MICLVLALLYLTQQQSGTDLGHFLQRLPDRCQRGCVFSRIVCVVKTGYQEILWNPQARCTGRFGSTQGHNIVGGDDRVDGLCLLREHTGYGVVGFDSVVVSFQKDTVGYVSAMLLEHLTEYRFPGHRIPIIGVSADKGEARATGVIQQMVHELCHAVCIVEHNTGDTVQCQTIADHRRGKRGREFIHRRYGYVLAQRTGKADNTGRTGIVDQLIDLVTHIIALVMPAGWPELSPGDAQRAIASLVHNSADAINDNLAIVDVLIG